MKLKGAGCVGEFVASPSGEEGLHPSGFSSRTRTYQQRYGENDWATGLKKKKVLGGVLWTQFRLTVTSDHTESWVQVQNHSSGAVLW